MKIAKTKVSILIKLVASAAGDSADTLTPETI